MGKGSGKETWEYAVVGLQGSGYRVQGAGVKFMDRT